MKYILVYVIDEYPEMGGGTQYEEFDNGVSLDKRVEEIYNDHRIIVAGELEEFHYKAVEKVTKLVRDE